MLVSISGVRLRIDRRQGSGGTLAGQRRDVRCAFANVRLDCRLAREERGCCEATLDVAVVAQRM